jgi:hypothetical protein
VPHPTADEKPENDRRSERADYAVFLSKESNEFPPAQRQRWKHQTRIWKRITHDFEP